MKWGFRWYGEKGDSIPLKYVRQIPGINGIIGTLLTKMPGDVWEISEIEELKASVESQGLELLGIESVAIHDAIKAGTDERDYYIDNYIRTIKNLSRCGVRLICYSFKPIFDGRKLICLMKTTMEAILFYTIRKSSIRWSQEKCIN